LTAEKSVRSWSRSSIICYAVNALEAFFKHFSNNAIFDDSAKVHATQLRSERLS